MTRRLKLSEIGIIKVNIEIIKKGIDKLNIQQ